MHKSVVYIADVLVIGITLAILASLFHYTQPLLIAPIDNYSTSDTSVLFSFSAGERLLIDDNTDFSSPQVVTGSDTVQLNLKPGIYYWKVEGVRGSEIRQLTVQSTVDLQVRQRNGTYEVVNAGNTPLNVDVYDKGTLVGNLVVNVEKNASAEGDTFVGREHA